MKQENQIVKPNFLINLSKKVVIYSNGSTEPLSNALLRNEFVYLLTDEEIYLINENI
jgi:hypothetical protein